MDETSDAHDPQATGVTGELFGHNGHVRSSLSRVPVEKRKQLAATLGLFSVLFVAVAAVSATGPGTAVSGCS